MSYYDIDAILTDAEKVPCKFELDVPDLGYLDNNPSHALKAGTQITLPLWLAEMLALANTGTAEDSKAPVTLNLPPALSQQVVQALKADPRAVPVRDQSAHFYGLGTRILDLFDERELSEVMRKTFVARASEIALHARKGTDDGIGGSNEDFLRGLDEWERGLFRKAHDGTKASKEWMDKVKKH
ncbi:Putative GINS complex, subunit Psf3, GINS subunit, domain A, GINS complex, subunit Psf3 superfamily [Colletotrichum destructivum]|uniref:DNA replication complex GINS protein PSF3 n=1 Tax=Colletotrichum destructivum TaxID=34406 RepID=A0AAX4IC86_9PEZI|nr:Putative GINS complex, subunit Psf3, GINS subunit, domain A, GINS complex, subunit Psf3 superfamily [Colletotrichum destructivum]